MSKVHFVDTSVLTELLNVPGLNKRHEEINAEYLRLDRAGDIFVLPVAVLVETGNHIAHVSDGNMRRQIAGMLASLVKGAMEGSSSWNVRPEIQPDVLKAILEQLPSQAQQERGFGDVSIIEQFNDYWEHKQPIGEMRIWSLDTHLQGFSKTGGLSRRKNK